MARPIKETPILRGENALRVLERMQNPEPLPKEKIEEIKRDYEWCKRMREKGKELETKGLIRCI
ncbi:MAG: hypothetical protein LBT35_04450 [Tannerella sp.]|jgi:hypothetical protein|nr:hypothetical protein [Tannerella sp.]